MNNPRQWVTPSQCSVCLSKCSSQFTTWFQCPLISLWWVENNFILVFRHKALLPLQYHDVYLFILIYYRNICNIVFLISRGYGKWAMSAKVYSLKCKSLFGCLGINLNRRVKKLSKVIWRVVLKIKQSIFFLLMGRGARQI